MVKVLTLLALLLAPVPAAAGCFLFFCSVGYAQHTHHRHQAHPPAQPECKEVKEQFKTLNTHELAEYTDKAGPDKISKCKGSPSHG